MGERREIMEYKPGILKILSRSITSKVMVIVIALGFGIFTFSSEVTAQDWRQSRPSKQREKEKKKE